jgi:hypothetical protein
MKIKNILFIAFFGVIIPGFSIINILYGDKISLIENSVAAIILSVFVILCWTFVWSYFRLPKRAIFIFILMCMVSMGSKAYILWGKGMSGEVVKELLVTIIVYCVVYVLFLKDFLGAGTTED